MRLACGSHQYGKWHRSAGQAIPWQYGLDEYTMTVLRLMTACGRDLEAEQADPWSPEQGGRPRFHIVIRTDSPTYTACRQCEHARAAAATGWSQPTTKRGSGRSPSRSERAAAAK